MEEPTLPETAGIPVEDLDTASTHREPEEGTALCLSGGGYRAMLFHLGAIWRPNEAGYLGKLARISSVSGGSITAGVLGHRWNRLRFDAGGVATAFQAEVVSPIRALAEHTIDRAAILGGTFLPGTIGDRVVASYTKHLFGEATLQDLPPDPPRFVINATNVQSGSLFRFMRPAMRDWRIGEVRGPTVRLAVAVAASSAFPPFLSPQRLSLRADDWSPTPGAILTDDSYKTEVFLTDGGVYDNLGLETAFKRYTTLLVSDAGMMMGGDPEPAEDWARHARRVLDLVDNQVRSLRRRQLMDALTSRPPRRKGAFWTIATPIEAYGVSGSLPCPASRTLSLAQEKTRLKAMDGPLQERLINWGYAACDGAMRAFVKPEISPPRGFPYPKEGV